MVSNSYSQSTNDSLIFQLPQKNPWDNPLAFRTSGLYLKSPSNIMPKFEFDAEKKSCIV